MKFVEAQQPGLVENRICRQRDDVGIAEFAASDVLAIAVDALMHLGHEFVEMRAALVRDGGLLEEQVHQHGLAAADLAVNVKPARRLAVVGKQPAEQALLAGRLVAGKPLFQRRKRLGGARLRRVGLDRAGGDEGLVMDMERGGRGRQHGPLSASSVRKLQAVNLANRHA